MILCEELAWNPDALYWLSEEDRLATFTPSMKIMVALKSSSPGFDQFHRMDEFEDDIFIRLLILPGAAVSLAITKCVSDAEE